MSEYIRQFAAPLLLCLGVIVIQCLYYGRRIYRDRSENYRLVQDIQKLESAISVQKSEITLLNAKLKTSDQRRRESETHYETLWAQYSTEDREEADYKARWTDVCEFIWGKPALDRLPSDVIDTIKALAEQRDGHEATSAGLAKMLLKHGCALREHKAAIEALNLKLADRESKLIELGAL
jgi:hypothetical protein